MAARAGTVLLPVLQNQSLKLNQTHRAPQVTGKTKPALKEQNQFPVVYPCAVRYCPVLLLCIMAIACM